MPIQDFEVYKYRIIKIIEMFFPDAKIYFFGSRARGDFTPQSDYDIAINNGKMVPITERGQIMSMIDHLNMPQRVDVVDFHILPQAMKDNILKEGIVWRCNLYSQICTISSFI